MSRRRASPDWGWLLAGSLALGCAGAAPPPSDFAGSTACRSCHAEAFAAWEPSTHARAAQSVSIAEFTAAAFDGVERRFGSVGFRPEYGASGPVLIDHGPDGDRRHPVDWVLGVRDVVQPLLPGPGGRWQAFPAAWDPARAEWFDVFPEAPGPDDWTHWQGPGATANTQCLECHVTGYAKGFELAGDRYATGWQEAGVGCEACHGAGARHVVAREAGTGDAYGTAAADPLGPGCVFCHARRVPLVEPYDPTRPTLDQLAPVLLDAPEAFHADGQLRGESYEWTSFQMSRMAAEGVVCADCHEPHAGTLRAAGNALCLTCHEPRFDAAAHTHHSVGSAGASCVACHMPVHVFMERDARRDHRIAVPDPVTALAVGAPDPCTSCHTDETQAWAAALVAAWSGGRNDAQTWREEVARALDAGRVGNPTAASGLVALLEDRNVDVIRRASAARLLEPWSAEPEARATLRRALSDDDALVRAGAAMALGAGAGEGDDAAAVAADLARAAGDQVRLVRTEAAFAMRAVALATFDDADPKTRVAVDRATIEWLAAQQVLAELPEPHFNTGVFRAARGEVAAAEHAYREALARWPRDRAPRYNLALLLAEADRTDDAIGELEILRAQAPAWPPVLASLALLRAEREEWPAVVDLLEACVRVAPLYPRAAYNLGLAYTKVGNVAFAGHALELATKDPASRADALRERVRLAYHRGDEAAVQALLPEALGADPALSRDPRVEQALETPR